VGRHLNTLRNHNTTQHHTTGTIRCDKEKEEFSKYYKHLQQTWNEQTGQREAMPPPDDSPPAASGSQPGQPQK